MAKKTRKLKNSTVIYLTVALSVLLLSFLSYGAFLAYRAAAADVAVPRPFSEMFFYLQQLLTSLASWVSFAVMAFAVSRFMKHTAWKSIAVFGVSYALFYISIVAIEYNSDDFISYMFSNLGQYTVTVFKYGYGFTLLVNLTFAVSSVLGALLVRHLFLKRGGKSGFRQDMVIMCAGVMAPMLVSLAEYAARFIKASAFSPSDFVGFAGDVGLVLLMNGLVPFFAGLLMVKILSARFK